jgi:hypothetical protein
MKASSKVTLDSAIDECNLDYENSNIRFKQFDPVKHFGAGWEIIEDMEKLPDNWSPANFALVSTLKAGEEWISSEEARRRLEGKPLLGGRALQYFLDNPSAFPSNCENKVVFFDAMVLRSPSGYRCVVYACRIVARVVVCYRWLDNGRVAGGPSALLASTSDTLSSGTLTLESLDARVNALEAWRESVKDQLL